LNGYEFVLTEDGQDVMKFNTIDNAMSFLAEATGVSYPTEQDWNEKEGLYFISSEDLEKQN
jgi:hypothetical protein